jgi:hypothetical protein
MFKKFLVKTSLMIPAVLLVLGMTAELAALPPHHGGGPGGGPGRFRGIDWGFRPGLDFGFRFVVGARYPFLPAGCRFFYVNDYPYWYWDGIYFTYLPHERVYVVVNAPEQVKETEPACQWDKLVLTDGSIVEGIYLGGTDETVKFQVGKNDIREYSRAQIASIVIAPAPQNSPVSPDSTATPKK